MKWHLSHKLKNFFNCKLFFVLVVFGFLGGVAWALEPGIIELKDTISSDIFEFVVVSEDEEVIRDSTSATWNFTENTFTSNNRNKVILVKVRVKDDACKQNNRKISNQATLSWLAGGGTSSKNVFSDQLNLRCPLYIEGDIGASNVEATDIVKVKGPAAVIATGNPAAYVATDESDGEVEMLGSYNNTNLKALIDQARKRVADINKNLLVINSLTQCPSENDVLIRKWSGGNLILGDFGQPAYSSKCNQTLIVDENTSDITIRNNFKGADTGKSFGLVYLGTGKITFAQNSNDKIQNFAVFAPDATVEINLYGGDNDKPFLMSGMIVANKIWVKTWGSSIGWGGRISWSGQIAQDPPPGFEKAAEISKISEVAPE